jgi:hypothetical protein
MEPHPHTTQALLDFNHAVLDQALALAAAHAAPGAPPYARPVGAHLRHLIEHYEALLHPALAGEVDYDQRPRDSMLERCPHTARQRLQAVQQRLLHAGARQLQQPLRVRGQAGLAGEFSFAVPSSLGRELVFLASHAVHHFAVLLPHCRLHGLPVGTDFGKAPATVAHERAAPCSTPQEDPTCKPTTATA